MPTLLARRNQAIENERLNRRRAPTLVEMQIILLHIFIVVVLSIIVTTLWMHFYNRAVVINNAVMYSSVYYHWSGDLLGSAKLTMFLPMCILAVTELKNLMASILLTIIFGVSYQGFRNFLFLFLMRAVFDLAAVFLVSPDYQDYVTLGLHLPFYTFWTVIVMLLEPEINGFEDVILIAIVGGQVYALINRMLNDDGTVGLIALLYLSWAKLKSSHVRQHRSLMGPAFTEGLTALMRAQFIQRVRQTIRNMPDIPVDTDELNENGENQSE